VKKFVEIETPLGEALLFHKLRGKEELGRLSEYEVDLLSTDGGINLDDVLGKSVTVKLELTEDKVRYFNGYVTRIAQVGMHGRYHAYRADVRPWLWFLTRTTNCRIFQGENVPDILKEVFAQHSAVADVKSELTETYTPWDYCVQYRETDFNFVSRLMEAEGIYYYFKHTEGRHTLVLADSYSAHSLANGGEIPFIEPEKLGRRERNHVSEWSHSHELQPGKYALTDYDFEKPSVSLQVKSHITREHAMAEYEWYDYPGDYIERGDGDFYARTRIEEIQAKFARVEGKTNARFFATGYLFTLTSHPREDQNAEYLILSTQYEIESTEYEAMPQQGARYDCTFSAMNSRQPFRTERTTAKPMVRGPQTATVVGPSGETIHTDKFGRVKVHFHWDRYGKFDDSDSCWIRVSQNWGGKGWGGIFIPHVGQEVIVMFEEGDPDRPLITGRVYNVENMPPMELPGNKTKSIIRDHGSNHIRMEGKAGSEQINMFSPYGNTVFSLGAPNQGEGGFFKTAYDWISDVGRNTKERIAGWRDTTVEQNYKLFVGGDTINEFKGAVQFKYDGINMKLHGGLVFDKFLGIKQTTVVGATVDYYVAHKTTRNISWEYKRSAGRVITRGNAKQDTVVQDTVTIDSDSKTQIIGGGGPNANHCNVTLDGATAKLTCGSSQITVNKDGLITIVGNSEIAVEAKGELTLISKSGKPVRVKGSVMDVDGKIQHKNFQVMKD
jgi:type VI secretion system secreted protein VgrG